MENVIVITIHTIGFFFSDVKFLFAVNVLNQAEFIQIRSSKRNTIWIVQVQHEGLGYISDKYILSYIDYILYRYM